MQEIVPVKKSSARKPYSLCLEVVLFVITDVGYTWAAYSTAVADTFWYPVLPGTSAPRFVEVGHVTVSED